MTLQFDQRLNSLSSFGLCLGHCSSCLTDPTQLVAFIRIAVVAGCSAVGTSNRCLLRLARSKIAAPSPFPSQLNISRTLHDVIATRIAPYSWRFFSCVFTIGHAGIMPIAKVLKRDGVIIKGML